MLIGTSYSPARSLENNNNEKSSSNPLSPDIEEQAKNYIEQYQASYPKESLEQGLLGLGITTEQAREVVNKYYSK